MGGAFQSDAPPKATYLLRPADTLLVQTLDSATSWLVMYLTSSEISHVAAYYGNGQIIHSTSAGVSIDPIESLFNQNTRVLLTQWNYSDDERAAVVKRLEDLPDMRYAWDVVFFKGIRILSGRDWPYFRWRFAADIAIVTVALDLPALLLLHQPVLTWLIPCYLALIIFHWLFWKIKPLPFNDRTGKPCDMLRIIEGSGGAIIFDAYEVAQQIRRQPI